MSQSKDNFLNDVFLTLQEYILKSEKNDFVVKVSSAESLKQRLPGLRPQGASSEEIVDELKTILENSVQTIHPMFLNQLFGGFDEAAWAGEIASTLLNPTMATFEIAPILTVIEKRLVSELLKMMGFERGEGIMVTGGSNSNLVAMLCARTEYSPSIRQTGFGHNRFRVYVSAEAHYSFDKAANITGIGTQNLIQVPSNEKGEMIAEELERIIKADLNEGYTPIMVGATLGTTVMGAFDPLVKIAKICETYKIWLHADAAWGGGALFSHSHKHLLKGLELADSVTFDAHKTLGTPLITSFFLTKHAGILKDTNRGGGAEYLFHEYDNSEWDTGTYSLQCGRRADALKLWLLWRAHGTEGLIKRTEHLLELAQYATKEISSNARFKLIHSHYLNVCFQVHARHDQENINSFTLRIRKELVQEGRALVNYAQRADGTIFFRLVFPNHQTQKSHISELLKIILETANRLDIV
ncbi:MAG: aminotransferase class V-fold PLP-dependent enzyme [Bacteriovoracaceae bacterium]|nr:aminotransferase class V-fold PLP-dependent enzyme [Bacteriovoracaceae bacterium]